MTDDVSTYAARVGERLRAVRNLAGMSLQDVRDRSGGKYDESAIGSWERGDREPPVEALADYATFLGVPVRALLPDFPDGDAILCRYASRAAAERARQTLTGIIPADSPAMITFAAIARSGDVHAEAAR